MLVNTRDGPTVRPLGIDDFLQIGRRFLERQGAIITEHLFCISAAHRSFE
jgi:hypothetical protein